ncbi:MAG: hypothetical protein HFG73_06070 [Hungatella sp.]|nr:hypothetical protein [Hungatella sp.]
MSGYMFKNGNLIIASEKVLASTCKMEGYKPLWVKDGVISEKCPKHFDFFLDDLYIVGTGEIIFPKVESLQDLPPYPNKEYDSRELFDSFISLKHSFDGKKYEHQINKTIKWCEKFGFPFFGNNGLYCGEIGTCYKSTQKIGFHFRTFLMDVYHLYDSFEKACLTDSELSIGQTTQQKNPYSIPLSKNIEHAITSSLNIAMLQRKQKYVYNNHKLICETGFETLISLAYYQFAILLLSPKGMSARRCEYCGALFATDNRKRKYCECCYPQKRYSQKTRIQKKAPDTN